MIHSHPIPRRRPLTLLALLLAAGLSGHDARAAVFAVDSTSDEFAHDADPGDGVCSDLEDRCTLRAAIEESNALRGADEVVLPRKFTKANAVFRLDDFAGTYLSITDDLTIRVAESPSRLSSPIMRIIDGSGHPIFYVAEGVTADLTGLELRNGSAIFLEGAAVHNDGHLTLSNVRVVNCSGTAVYSGPGSTLHLTATELIGRAGGLGRGLHMEEAEVSILSSTIRDHTIGTVGGGIYNDAGTLTLMRSTISGNTAGGQGGGGIFNAGTLVATDSTVSSNLVSSAQGVGGGILSQGAGSFLLQHVTVAENRAQWTHVSGVALRDPVAPSFVVNSVVGSNVFSNDLALGNCDPDKQSVEDPVLLVSLGGNVLGRACLVVAGPDDNVFLDLFQAALGPLQDNGGPTLTQAPVPGSFGATLVVDNGLASHCTASDQRGVPRPQGVACDSGAVELTGIETLQLIHASAIVAMNASLSAMIDSAHRSLTDANPRNDEAGRNILRAFAHLVEAQRGLRIPPEDADALLVLVRAVLTDLPDPPPDHPGPPGRR